jgi:hypothetical protein
MRLYFDWINGLHAFKTATGLGGLQWSAGRVTYGTVYDDDGPPPRGKRVSLARWIDDCVAQMKMAR